MDNINSVEIFETFREMYNKGEVVLNEEWEIKIKSMIYKKCISEGLFPMYVELNSMK